MYGGAIDDRRRSRRLVGVKKESSRKRKNSMQSVQNPTMMTFPFLQKRVVKANCEVPSLNNYSDDLCTLTQSNAATVLHALKIRYTSNVIHVRIVPEIIQDPSFQTYCGLFCVVINPWRNIPIYSDDVKQLYQHRNDLPPHVYSVAQNAFHGILKGGRSQSILIT